MKMKLADIAATETSKQNLIPMERTSFRNANKYTNKDSTMSIKCWKNILTTQNRINNIIYKGLLTSISNLWS